MIENGVLGHLSQNIITLKSEDDAWKLLEQLQDNRTPVPDDISIGDWCALNICLEGEKWESSLTTSIFPVFEEFQSAVYHAYAEAKYQNKKQKLKKEEKEALEIIIKVTKGSSKTQTSFDLATIAKACVNKMTSRDILIAVVVIALIWGGTTVYKDYVQSVRDTRIIELTNQDKKAMLESLQFMSQEETKRMEIYSKAVQTNPLVQSVTEDAVEVHQQMLKSATKAEASKINGVYLQKEVAQELVKTTKEEPKPSQINGTFQVLNLDWSEPHQITLKRIPDGIVVRAAFDLQWLSDESKEIIKNTEWKEDGHKVLSAQINARIIKDKIVSAELISVSSSAP